MFGELERRTGVHTGAAPTPARPAPMRDGGSQPRQRSLVRIAVALLVQNPEFAAAVEPPFSFAELRQPGIPLLAELLTLCREQPGLTTAAVLERFAARDGDERALAKLALMDFPGAEEDRRLEFTGAIAQLERQTEAQRRADLHARLRELESRGEAGLDDAERDELRRLLAAKVERGTPAH